MEKVTFSPLIAILTENAEMLNQALAVTGLVSRGTTSIPDWFSGVIEPVFVAVYKHDKTRSRKVFDVLFRDMLNLLQGSSLADSELSRDCRLLLRLNPALAAAHPARILSAMTTALKKIVRHSHKAAQAWIELMQRIVPLVTDVDQMLAAGRLAAWRCGMAHLRDLAAIPAELDPRIVAIIFADENTSAEQFRQRWGVSQKPVVTAAGAFSGSGGQFVRPPRVTLLDGVVFVSDGSQIRALFADRFGHVLVECAGSSDDFADFSLKSVSTAPPHIAKILVRYKDLTSWVHDDSTLYLTTGSSHSVFLFGAVNG